MLGPPSADVSFSSSDSQVDVAEPGPGPRAPANVPSPPLAYGCSESSATAIIDWEYIFQNADQSCVDPDSVLRDQLKVFPSPALDLDFGDYVLGTATTSSEQVKEDVALDQDSPLLDFGHRIRSLWSSMNRKDGSSQTIAMIREDLHAISKQIEDWIVTSATPSNQSQASAHDIEKYKNTILGLEQENLDFSERVSSLERELSSAKSMGEAWKAEARNVQNMQEIAVSAFERCNALETENLQLKQAMHAFAEGSTSKTVKELRNIISDLTRELAQYKKREAALHAKETQLRAKENASIIEDMRKQTEDLKVSTSRCETHANTVLTVVNNSGDGPNVQLSR